MYSWNTQNHVCYFRRPILEQPEPGVLRSIRCCKINFGTPRTVCVISEAQFWNCGHDRRAPAVHSSQGTTLGTGAQFGTGAPAHSSQGTSLGTGAQFDAGAAAHTCQGTSLGRGPQFAAKLLPRRAVPLTWHPQGREAGAALQGQQQQQEQPRGRAQPPRAARAAQRPGARRAAAVAGRRAM